MEIPNLYYNHCSSMNILSTCHIKKFNTFLCTQYCPDYAGRANPSGIRGDWHRTLGKDSHPATYVILGDEKPVLCTYPVGSGATWCSDICQCSNTRGYQCTGNGLVNGRQADRLRRASRVKNSLSDSPSITGDADLRCCIA